MENRFVLELQIRVYGHVIHMYIIYTPHIEVYNKQYVTFKWKSLKQVG